MPIKNANAEKLLVKKAHTSVAQPPSWDQGFF